MVGIGTFQDTSIKGLEYTRQDAESFRNLLVDVHGGGFSKENVRLLTDGDATLEGIKESLNWLARSAAPEDLVVVYIASHGSSRDLDTAGANYILTHDTHVGSTGILTSCMPQLCRWCSWRTMWRHGSNRGGRLSFWTRATAEGR